MVSTFRVITLPLKSLKLGTGSTLSVMLLLMVQYRPPQQQLQPLQHPLAVE
jgi:hypothetical protein